MRDFFSCLIIVSLAYFSVQAQITEKETSLHESSLFRQAERYFEKAAYSNAIHLYQLALSGDSDDHYIKLKLGECYRLQRDPDKAANWYGQAFKQKISEAHIYQYASALTANEQYAKAAFWYRKNLNFHQGDQRTLAALHSLQDLQYLTDYRYQVKMLDIRLTGNLFSPAYFRDGLVVVGEGNTGGFAKTLATWNESPYFDLYFVPVNQGKPGAVSYLDNKINSMLHEGPAVFFDQDNKVIFTRSNGRKGPDDTRNLQLMIAEKKSSGKWSTPRKLFANPGYSTAHPATDDQGTVLYFSSDRPGGYGGSDIYYSRLVDGRWSQPENLGPTVNTAGNELFPTLDSEGILYFASDGHGGMGGLDIFRFKTTETGQPVNLGYPINSSADDFGIIFSQDQMEGYFSSRRTGVDRIYRFEKQPQLAKAAVPDN